MLLYPEPFANHLFLMSQRKNLKGMQDFESTKHIAQAAPYLH